MLKNPVQLRLEKLATWQKRLFMLCLCERMYINFYYYFQLIGTPEEAKSYKKILDLVWESLIVKQSKINFDLQLEKLETIIPTVTDDSPYMIYPAIDACQALSELLHSYLSDDIDYYTSQVSSISATTIAEYEMTKSNNLLTNAEQEKLPEVIEEFDFQWEIMRILRDQENVKLDLIKGLREDVRDLQTSNIGAFLSA